MSLNPYQSPTLTEDTTAIVAARRRLAPVAMGLQVSGALVGIFGVLGLMITLFGIGSWIWLYFQQGLLPYAETVVDVVRICGGSAIGLLVSALAIYAGKRLRRLDSLRWAYAACGLSIVFYPMCIITLPLGIYGLFVLRRADVRAVLKEQQAARRGTMPLDEPQPG